MGSYDPEALRRTYTALAEGDTRMRAIRSACTEAEQAGDLRTALLFHHDLIRESVFTGDRLQALVDFPQYLSIYRSDPAFEDCSYEMLWLFKWVVEAAVEFPQIEKKQVLTWFSEFRRELIRHGWSCKPFYEKRAIFLSYYDRASMMLDYEDFLNAPRDALSDGVADEYDTIVRWELEIGSREKAMEAAEHIFREQLLSEEIPATTFGYLLADAMRRGDAPAAEQYAAKLRPLCTGKRMRTEQIGLLLLYDAAADPGRGLSYYAAHTEMRAASRNPFLSFWFDRGASALLSAAAKAGLTLHRTGKPETPPDALAAEAARLRASAQALAERFDERNGSAFFSAALSAADSGSSQEV